MAQLQRRASDILAWVAFVALLIWIAGVLIALSGYWQIYEFIAAVFESVDACEGESCRVQMSLEGEPAAPTVLGFDLGIIERFRYPAFLIWLVIVFFQSLFVRRFRVLPWKSIGADEQSSIERD